MEARTAGREAKPCARENKERNLTTAVNMLTTTNIEPKVRPRSAGTDSVRADLRDPKLVAAGTQAKSEQATKTKNCIGGRRQMWPASFCAAGRTEWEDSWQTGKPTDGAER
jgi:hypothetical protein